MDAWKKERGRKSINQKEEKMGWGKYRKKYVATWLFVNRKGNRGPKQKKMRAQKDGREHPSHGDSNSGADLAPLPPLLSLVPCVPQRPMAGKLRRSCRWGLLAERKMSQTETFWKERTSLQKGKRKPT